MLARPVDVFIRMWCMASNTIIVASLTHDSSYFFLVAVCSCFFCKPTFQKCFRFWGTLSPRRGTLPLDPTMRLPSPRPLTFDPPLKNFQRRPWIGLLACAYLVEAVHRPALLQRNVVKAQADALPELPTTRTYSPVYTRELSARVTLTSDLLDPES